MDNAYLPVHILKHKKKTKVIQTWHACSAFKKFGLSTLGLEDGIKSGERDFIHKNYDYAITTSHRVIAPYAEAFGMEPEKIIPLGVPRTDYFFDVAEMQKQKDKIYSNYPMLKNKKTILYAPTFRGRGKDKYTEFSLDAEKFLDALEEEYVLLIKPHPHAKIRDAEGIMESKKDPERGSNVVVFPGDYPLNALFCVADLLITDYSSVIFEFALLNKPMVFYPYDLQEYTESSSFYVDYTKFVPGPIAMTQAELTTEINEKAWLNYDIHKFAQENFDSLDGQASRRFVERFLK
ncbi:MAG: CDP-glycerol--glycerophosphate glycerophosphotransferase [Eubacteriaceae bacterium]|nr:CDP-glycerol--glycerophosphate glycerophosphotransferase [Eubacteriaceae bacterium]